MRVLTQYVMRGRRQAILVALIASVIPLFSWVSVVVMALVTLRKGAREGLLILAWFSLSTWTLLQFGHVPPMIGYTGLLGGLVVWGQACLLRQRQSWSLVIEASVLLAVIVIGFVHLYFGDVQAWWQTHLSSLLQGLSQRLQLQMSKPDAAALVAFMSRFFSGLQALSILFNALVNLLFARGCQAMAFNPGGLRAELYQLRVGHWVSALFVVVAVLTMGDVSFGYDVLPVVVMPFVLAGLSLVHSLFLGSKQYWLMVVGFYGIMLLFLPYVVGLLIMFAFADTWMNLRGRMKLQHI